MRYLQTNLLIELYAPNIKSFDTRKGTKFLKDEKVWINCDEVPEHDVKVLFDQLGIAKEFEVIEVVEEELKGAESNSLITGTEFKSKPVLKRKIALWQLKKDFTFEDRFSVVEIIEFTP